MANPKRKHTRSRRDTRRNLGWLVKEPSVARCSNCGALKIPHHVCPVCGFYNAQPILPPKESQEDKKGKSQEEKK